MKKALFFVVALSMLAGCASGPTLILVKNCKDLGGGISQCEEIPKKDIQGGSKRL